jgi:hypothetical protein
VQSTIADDGQATGGDRLFLADVDATGARYGDAFAGR